MTKVFEEAEKVSINELEPYHKNPKIHTEEQIEKIKDSIENFGFTQPIVANGEGILIIGHGRLQAAKNLGMEEVPVIVREDLSEKEEKALRIADNKTSMDTGFEPKKLAEELDDLREDKKIEFSAFEMDEAESILEELEEEDVPEDFDDIEEKSTEHECPECGYEW